MFWRREESDGVHRRLGRYTLVAPYAGHWLRLFRFVRWRLFRRALAYGTIAAAPPLGVQRPGLEFWPAVRTQHVSTRTHILHSSCCRCNHRTAGHGKPCSGHGLCSCGLRVTVSIDCQASVASVRSMIQGWPACGCLLLMQPRKRWMRQVYTYGTQCLSVRLCFNPKTATPH